MKNKFKNRILSFFLALTMIIGFVPINGINNVVEAAGEYEGYDFNNGDSESSALYIKQTGVTPNPDVDEIVYCFNATRGIPTAINGGQNADENTIYPKYTKEDGTATNFANSLVVSPIPNNLSADELQAGVLKAIYNGFNNQRTNSELQTALSLSDQEMRDATQAAVWYFTDGYSFSDANATGHISVYGNSVIAYKLLTGQYDSTTAQYESLVKDVPAQATLDLFKYTVPSGSIDYAYQNLVSASFSNLPDETPTTIDVNVEKVWSRLDGSTTAPEGVIATINLLADGQVVDTVELSGTTLTHTFTGLDSTKTYTVEEVEIDGYTSSVTGDATNGFVVTNTEDEPEVTPTTVLISKVDITNKEELPGAELTVEGGDLTSPITWTSTTTPEELSLNPGTYTLTEVTAPEGYEVAETITFVVTEEGTVTVDGTVVTDNTVVMEDAPVVKETVDVNVNKKWVNNDGTTTVPAGVAVTINLLADGQIVADKELVLDETNSWAGSFTGLDKYQTDGTTEIVYTVEEASIDGYTAGYSVDSPNNITVTNTEIPENHYPVSFSKQDILGEELPGASIEVRDANGVVVESWVSTTIAHEMSLPAGDYTMVETAAPEGYAIATEITFTVNADGTVTGTGVSGNTVTMIDDYAVKETTVKFSKRDIEGDELEGATIVLKDSEENVLEEWISDGTVKEFTLVEGSHTFEETAAPQGYEIATEITFDVVRDEETKELQIVNIVIDGLPLLSFDGVIVMVDEYKEYDTTVKFSKQDIEGNELEGATIVLKDSEENVLEEWISDGTVKEFTLVEGSYTFEETATPEGYEIATVITFDVVRNAETKELEITNVVIGEGNKVSDDDENHFIMVDDYTVKETETEEETPVETEKETPVETEKETEKETPIEVTPDETNDEKPGTPDKGHNPNTGDNFNTILYVGLAAVALLGLVVLRKKNELDK